MFESTIILKECAHYFIFKNCCPNFEWRKLVQSLIYSGVLCVNKDFEVGSSILLSILNIVKRDLHTCNHWTLYSGTALGQNHNLKINVKGSKYLMRYFSLAYFDCATSYSLCGLLAARRGGMCWLVFVLIAKLSSWTINHQLIHVSRCLNINNIEIKIIPSLEARLFLSELLPEWLFLIIGITITIVHSDSDNSDKIAGTITFFYFSMIFSELFTI